VPNADATTGHLSAALAHFANIATRLGSTLRFDPVKEAFIACRQRPHVGLRRRLASPRNFKIKYGEWR
jgi:hypothetical protein